MSGPPLEEVEKPAKKKKSRYFGFACKRAFELRDSLDAETLTVDDLLDITETQDLVCPRHPKTSCKCTHTNTVWIADEHGRLALKLFLKHLEGDLEGDRLSKFSVFMVDNADRIEELKVLIAGHEKLEKKLQMLLEFYS